MFYLSGVLLLLSASLVVGDALITKSGLSLGSRETNPVQAFVLGKFGMMGLLATRLLALMLLLLLFVLLNPWEWILFASTFLVVMVVVIWLNIRKLRHEPQKLLANKTAADGKSK